MQILELHRRPTKAHALRSGPMVGRILTKMAPINFFMIDKDLKEK